MVLFPKKAGSTEPKTELQAFFDEEGTSARSPDHKSKDSRYQQKLFARL